MVSKTATKAIYDGAQAFTAYDVIVQLGNVRGNIVAFRCRKWVPDVPSSEVDGEEAYAPAGPCRGLAGGDEVVLAFL
jgi:hypothetical protein